MVTIEILASCSGINFSYFPGEVVDVEPEQAADLIKHQLALPVEPKKPETAAVVPTGQLAKRTPAGQTATVKPNAETRRR
ncbi:hypothetical protein [Spirosoma endbachense]|uniref:Uncharacterized protein n=1 Tax=Spirosoma endbachense TaxID=2666025 RepID=A0A6P1W5K9_9BACT|nr:hypothetical protein [Spirosoma endbachense]QHV99220.1 hypothetical protein GJR95_31275 [Spirosoma endbachense]